MNAVRHSPNGVGPGQGRLAVGALAGTPAEDVGEGHTRERERERERGGSLRRPLSPAERKERKRGVV